MVGESLDAEPFDEDGGFLVRRRIQKVGSEERGVRAATGRELQRRRYQVQQGRIAFPRRVVVVVVVVASCGFGKRFVYSQRRERRDALGVCRVKVRPLRPGATSEPPTPQHEAPQVRRLLPRERRGPRGRSFARGTADGSGERVGETRRRRRREVTRHRRVVSHRRVHSRGRSRQRPDVEHVHPRGAHGRGDVGGDARRVNQRSAQRDDVLFRSLRSIAYDGQQRETLELTERAGVRCDGPEHAPHQREVLVRYARRGYPAAGRVVVVIPVPGYRLVRSPRRTLTRVAHPSPRRRQDVGHQIHDGVVVYRGHVQRASPRQGLEPRDDRFVARAVHAPARRAGHEPSLLRAGHVERRSADTPRANDRGGSVRQGKQRDALERRRGRRVVVDHVGHDVPQQD